jgi:hypothetical protein
MNGFIAKYYHLQAYEVLKKKYKANNVEYLKIIPFEEFRDIILN